MTNRLAIALQASGIAATAAGVGMYSLPGGIIVAGVGAVAVGVSLELSDRPPAAQLDPEASFDAR